MGHVERFEQHRDMVLCTMCSHWSLKDKWVDERCPLCGQPLVLADEAETCPVCNRISRGKDIINGRCPKCR